MSRMLERKALEGTHGTTMEALEQNADMEVLRSVIKAGGSIPEHQHKVASSYVVTAGSGKLTGTGARNVSAGDVVVIPAGGNHGWQAGEGQDLTIVGVLNGKH